MRFKALLISCLLELGVGVLTTAIFLTDRDNSDLIVTSNPAIIELIPGRGDEVLPQNTVGTILAPGWTGSFLTIGNAKIPLDQQRIEPALNSVMFRPGKNKIFERLPSQKVCASVEYWEVQTPDRTSTISWCFRVSG